MIVSYPLCDLTHAWLSAMRGGYKAGIGSNFYRYYCLVGTEVSEIEIHPYLLWLFYS